MTCTDEMATHHDDRRAHVRRDVLIDGQLRSGTGACRAVLIEDLSAGGCQFKSPVRLETGMFLTIRLGQVGPIDARLRWQQDDHCGVGFERSLYAPVLDHIAPIFARPSLSTPLALAPPEDETDNNEVQ